MRLKRQLFRPGRRIEQFGAPLFFGLGTDGQGALPWLAQNLSAIFTILLSAVLIAALAAVLYAIVRELRRNTVFLDPIDVPRALAARGYSPAVVAERLLDALLAMQRRAPTLKELRGVDASAALVDLQYATSIGCCGSRRCTSAGRLRGKTKATSSHCAAATSAA